MEIQGLTPVDTLYEYAGYAIGGRLSEYLLWNGYFVAFVVAAALLRLYYAGSRKGTYVEMAVYPLYVLTIAGLLWPIEVAVSAPGSETYADDGRGGRVTAGEGVFWYPDVATEEGQAALGKPKTLEVPRILALTHALADALQHAFVEDVGRTLLHAGFQWLRVAAIAEKSRILDLELRRDFGLYLASCYWPAMAADPREADPWQSVPLSGLPVDERLLGLYRGSGGFAVYGRTHLFPERTTVPCAEFHGALRTRLEEHLAREPFHARAIETYAGLAEREGNAALGREAYARFYLRRLVYNETFVVGESEAERIRAALPEFELLHGGGIDLTYTSANARLTNSFWSNVPLAVKSLPDVVAAIVAGVSEWWAQKTIGPATYYRVSAIAPYIYGLVVAFLALLFPVAGLWAFWPHRWTAIVNFLKVFLSVKLWPVLWAFLSGLIGWRARFDPESPHGLEGTFGPGGMFPALAGMYLATPLLSYIVVSLATQAGAVTLGSIVQGAQTGSLRGAADALGSAAGGAAAAVQWARGRG